MANYLIWQFGMLYVCRPNKVNKRISESIDKRVSLIIRNQDEFSLTSNDLGNYSVSDSIPSQFRNYSRNTAQSLTGQRMAS
jgi:hypothetical protein